MKPTKSTHAAFKIQDHQTTQSIVQRLPYRLKELRHDLIIWAVYFLIKFDLLPRAWLAGGCTIVIQLQTQWDAEVSKGRRHFLAFNLIYRNQVLWTSDKRTHGSVYSLVYNSQALICLKIIVHIRAHLTPFQYMYCT